VRVGIIQSSFIPWRGYFDFIASVDLFIFYDDVQFSKGSWRNRNLIKCQQGTKWLTVPVRHQSLKQLIMDTEIDDRTDWRSLHLKHWASEYANTPYFEDVLNLLGTMGQHEDQTISQLNVRLIKAICAYLNINTPLMLSSELNAEGARTGRLINVLKAVGATSYLSGPSADDYLEKEKFKKASIRLEYKSYSYESYPQLWGNFYGAVTVLDLIANCGPEAKKYLNSLTENKVVI